MLRGGPDRAARLGRSGLDEWVGIRRASRLQKPALSPQRQAVWAPPTRLSWRSARGRVAGGETAQRASPGKNPRSHAFVRVLCALLRVVARCCALTCVPAFSYKESRVEEAVQLRTADERGGHLMERAATGGRAPRVGDAVRLEPTVTIFVGSPRVGRWPSKTSPWASRSSARTPSLRWRAVAFRRGKCELYCQIRGARRPWCVPGGSS